MLRPYKRQLEFYFADLELRLEIGVVGDVGEDFCGVGSPCFDERRDGFEIHMAQSDVEGRGAWRAAGETLFYGGIFYGGAEKAADHWNVVVAVVGHVEFGVGLMGIEDADFDHFLSPRLRVRWIRRGTW